MSSDVIVENRFDTAAEFLAALRPSDDRWKTDPAAWVYRGHADSRWLLLPSQNRRAALSGYFGARYQQGTGPYCEPDPADLGGLMVEFVFALERSGYVVPGVGRFKLEEIAEKVRAGTPDSHTHEVVALAQHHGLPTYMLDWTRHSNVAAYFAASETANLEGELSGDIEVWALHLTAGDWDRQPGRIDGEGAKLWVSTPARGGNPNLHAQSGLFTYVQRQYEKQHYARGEDAGVFAADAVVIAMAKAASFGIPVMHRLRLPQSEAGAVLDLLSHERVTGGILFPGVGGVVRDVRDRMHFPPGVRDRPRLPRKR